MSIDQVQDIEPRDQYVAGSSQTAFNYSFPIFSDSDLVVYVGDVLQTLTTNYTVSGAGDDNGGTITFTAGLTAGDIITIYRDVPIQRTTDFAQNGPRRSADMNDELDRITMWMQQLESRIGRAIRQSLRNPQPSSELEIDSTYNGRYLYVNDDGELVPSVGPTDTPITEALIQSFIDQAFLGETLHPITDAETAAVVTPDSYQYISGDTGPGDIRRYGVTNSSSAAAVAAAVQKALASHGYAFVPYADNGLWNWNPVLFTAPGQSIYFATGTTMSSSSSGTLIDFDGYKRCVVEGFGRFLSTTAARCVRVGPDSGETRFAHWFKVRDISINGEAAFNEGSGTPTGFTTAGIEINRAYYGTVRECDIALTPVGVLGLNECNGNFITHNSIRSCHRGIHMTDTTRNSDGTVISFNEIEGGATGNLYGIEIQGSSSMMVAQNRLEYSVNGTAHIFIHDGANDAVRHSLIDNRCLGDRPSIIIGDNSGANRLTANSIRGGWYSSTITIGVDADYTEVDIPSGRYIGGGAGAVGASLINNSTTSIFSMLEDQSTTLTLTGCTTSPTGAILWTLNKGVVTLYLPTITGTSNTTAATLTTLPAFIRPSATRNIQARILDNSVAVSGMISIATSGVITLTNSVTGGGAMTSGNDKGILSGPISYPI
jgi:hypothetical protein